MKTFKGGCTFHQMSYVFIFFIFLLQACASAPGVGERIEGSDFKESLPGLWEGSWRHTSSQARQHIKIIKIEGNEVHLTGLMGGGAEDPETDKVNGRIENSKLLLTWPDASDSGCNEQYTMTRDGSNKLALHGNQICGPYVGNVSLFKKE